MFWIWLDLSALNSESFQSIVINPLVEGDWEDESFPAFSVPVCW